MKIFKIVCHLLFLLFLVCIEKLAYIAYIMLEHSIPVTQFNSPTDLEYFTQLLVNSFGRMIPNALTAIAIFYLVGILRMIWVMTEESTHKGQK